MTDDLATMDVRETDEIVKADAWKNIYFDINGHAFMDQAVYASEEDARIDSERVVALVSTSRASRPELIHEITDDDETWAIHIDHYSHTVAIPWKGGAL